MVCASERFDAGFAPETNRFRFLSRVDFLNASEVASAFECGGEPGFHDLMCFGQADGAFAEGEDVAVVVRTVPDGDLFVPAQAAAHAFDAVGDDGLAVARAAEYDAAFKFAARDGFGGGADIIGVVAGVGAMGAEIAYGMALGEEHGFDAFFVVITGVVRADGDGIGLHAINWKMVGLSVG